jgi:glutaredoxin
MTLPSRQLLLLAGLCAAIAGPLLAAPAPQCPRVDVYVRQGCPHCANAKQFLQQLRAELPELEVVEHDVVLDPEAREAFRALNLRHGIERPGVPSILICGQFTVGFDREGSPQQLRGMVLGEQVLADAGTPSVTLPLIGTITLSQVGLPLFTLAIGGLDGFNPCAMWVLLFLLSLLVNLHDRRRMLIIAGTFVLVSGAVYFAFMAAWLNLFLLLGMSTTIQRTIAVLALLIASVHLKDFFAAGRGPSLSIPEDSKAGLYARMRAVVRAENLLGSLLWVILLAVLVNLVELLCTAGLPALYTRILTLQPLSTAGYYGYLLLYNLAYIFDDALMVAIVVASLSRAKLQPQQGRWLKLLSGLTVLALGVILLVAPELLF